MDQTPAVNLAAKGEPMRVAAESSAVSKAFAAADDRTLAVLAGIAAHALLFAVTYGISPN